MDAQDLVRLMLLSPLAPAVVPGTGATLPRGGPRPAAERCPGRASRARRSAARGGGWVGRLGVLLLALAGAGCMPAVTHGPRVEPGLWTGSTTGLRLGSRPEGEVEAWGRTHRLGAPGGLFARYGFARTADTPPILLGVNLPYSLAQAELDVYAQITPEGARADAGAGALIAPSYLMPYAQWGTGRDRHQWYLTQGIGVFGYAGTGPRALLWLPAGVWRREPPRRPHEPPAHNTATHYFVQLAVGREWVREETGDRTRSIRILMLGVSTESRGIPFLPGF